MEAVRTCKKCGESKPLETSFMKHARGNGRIHTCRSCWNKNHREKWPEDPEKKRLRTAKYHRENLEKERQRKSEWRERNRDRVVGHTLKWAASNKDKVNAANSIRRAERLKRTPSWLSEDDLWMIQEAYSLAQLRQEIVGGKWHVDHIVPLNGKTVSGLHVPWNLRVITATENCVKSNKLIEEFECLQS